MGFRNRHPRYRWLHDRTIRPVLAGFVFALLNLVFIALLPFAIVFHRWLPEPRQCCRKPLKKSAV